MVTEPSVDRGIFGLRKIPTAPVGWYYPKGDSRVALVLSDAELRRIFISDKSDARRRLPQWAAARDTAFGRIHPDSPRSHKPASQPLGKELLPYEVVQSLLRHDGPPGHGDLGLGQSLWGREELWLHSELPAESLPAGDLQARLPDEAHLPTANCLLQAHLQPRCGAFVLPPRVSVCDARSDGELCSVVRPDGLWSGWLWSGCDGSGLCRSCRVWSDGSGLCRSRELRSGRLRSCRWSRVCRSGRVWPDGSRLCRSRGVWPGCRCELRRSRQLHGSDELRNRMCEDA